MVQIQPSEEKLLRAVGLKEIIALTINAIIGAGIFAIPANAAAILGISSPIAFVGAGLFTLIIVLCFAELGGKFDRTGGAYLYASTAYSSTVAFVIGWMYFLARLTASAALSNKLADFAGYFFPVYSPIRELLIIFAFLLLGIINYLGVKFSSRIINFLTLAKLIPLSIFIVAGLIFMNWNSLSGMSIPPLKSYTEALLLVMFVFTGFEVIGIPGGEMIRPKRNLPLGLLIGTAITIVVYVLIQIVAVATNPELATSPAPLAETAKIFLGRKGGTLLSTGAICSVIGTLTSLALVGPRIIYAMSLNRQMPAVLSKIQSKFRTPHISIGFYTLVSIAVSVTSSFETLAKLSVMARLMTYIATAGAVLILRKRMPSTDTFRIPGGILVPLLTILISLFLLTAATRAHWIIGSIALGIGLILYFVALKGKKTA